MALSPEVPCPDCQKLMRPLTIGKQVSELYCEPCDLSIDSEGRPHRGNKKGPGEKEDFVEVTRGRDD